MGMDIDYIAGQQAIKKLEKIFKNFKHGERETIADDIIEFVKSIEKKYAAISEISKLIKQ